MSGASVAFAEQRIRLAENVVRAAKGVRWARKTYMMVSDSQVYYDRLFAALEEYEAALAGRVEEQ